ncbi:uncharacterized protein Dvir_GJ25668 [Drosophila virilis]|uniref:UPAR/Ly6 domain-containing protein n=1 Tax=Drosophila virilis TaxID=7244 RepID=A0A0Q9W880_DROVI|nr:uncharacterized protein Dvir_GJ25668 [Drosophila virilis]
MWKKLVIALFLWTFTAVQHGNALTCYSCDSVESCRNANTQECSNETALENNAPFSRICRMSIISTISSASTSLIYPIKL